MSTIDLDNRGLGPPEPMVRILAALPKLGEGDELRVLMDREPLLLYPELTRRGFGWLTTEADDGYVIMIGRAVLE